MVDIIVVVPLLFPWVTVEIVTFEFAGVIEVGEAVVQSHFTVWPLLTPDPISIRTKEILLRAVPLG